MSSELARVAAQWWADHLRTRPVMNSGDALNTLTLSMQASDNSDLDELTISLFELALRDEITHEMANSQYGPAYAVVGVDYHPDLVLDRAASIAGININRRLPIKTTMTIEDQCVVSVKVGYGSPFEILYKEGE